MPTLTPEQIARQQIDAQLVACGWIVQDFKAVDFSAGRSIALREVPLKTDPCDYLLPADLDRSVVVPDQIRTILRTYRDFVATDQIYTVLATFRDNFFTQMFPGRSDLPKKVDSGEGANK